MKRLYQISLLFILAGLSVSCSPKGTIDPKTTIAKDVDLYSLIEEKESNIKSDYKVDTFTFRIIEDEPEILYSSLETFASTFSYRMLDGFKTTIEKDYWCVANSEDKLCFYLNIDMRREVINVGGSLSSALKETMDLSKSSLMARMNSTSVILDSSSVTVPAYSYKGLGFETFYVDHVPYFPISLLNLVMSDTAGIHSLYSYGSLYQFTDNSVLKNDFADAISPYKEMDNYIKNNLNNSMPEHIIKDRKASIYFLFCNLYGLKSTKQIADMKAYMDNDTNLNNLTSSNPTTNDTALTSFVKSLDDGHTAIRQASPWQQGDYSYIYGQLWTRRLALLNDLRARKNEELADHGVEMFDPIYSEDGSLAVININDFNWINDCYESDNSLKEEVYVKDTFFRMYRQISTIKDHGGVEDIVLDLSLNTGGTIGVLCKMLALLSNDNKGSVHFKKEDINTIYTMDAAVDSNGDGEYNQADVFGGDFNFYILTSECSFSCGNAFPYMSKYLGFAKIIGQVSGGGECSVGQHMLPTGEMINHSSLNHIGYYKEEEGFTGDEAGAPLDMEVPYADFYDVEKLRSTYCK